MASGDSLFMLTPQSGQPPSANFATLDTVSDASTPNIVFLVADFDGGGTNESLDWVVNLPSQYSETTGLSFSVEYASDGTAAGTVEWEIRALDIADLDILTADLGIDTQTATTITDTLPGTPINKFNVTAFEAMAKANFGSAAPPTKLLIRVTRDTVTDTSTDDAQLLTVFVKET